MYDVIVVGAGPAGMMAAGTAAENGKSVLLIEKNDRVGKKLMITGKGRCNVTNIADRDEMMKNIPVGGRFLFSSFARFDSENTINFFEELGVPLKTERGGRVFPKSDKSADIVRAMQDYINSNGVRTVRDTVTELITDGDKITGVKTQRQDYSADAVIIATGGMSYPKTGSTGDGYRLAAQVGHTVITPRASLVPIVTNEEWVTELQGLSLKNVRLELCLENKKVFDDFGEMLFTHFGVSGPIVLSASCFIKENKNYSLKIDLKPALDENTLDKRILRDFAEAANKDFINALGSLLPSKMIPVVVKLSEIPPHTKVNSVTRVQREKLIKLLKGLTLTVKSLRPIDEAIVTSGGVCLKEINPSTMESKLIDGLYFAGEVIDADAYTGGYNLQIAFSTGNLAGKLV